MRGRYGIGHRPEFASRMNWETNSHPNDEGSSSCRDDPIWFWQPSAASDYGQLAGRVSQGSASSSGKLSGPQPGYGGGGADLPRNWCSRL